jgi:hypothetical protein
MSRAAIVATIVTGILAFSSTCFAASDAELAAFGDKMSGAFRCSTYAGMFHDQKEQARLFQIGLKAARDFVEGMKSRPPMSELPTYMPGASTDFLVGLMYATQSTKAEDEIVKYRDEQQRERTLDQSQAKSQAELTYHKSNCSLIN